MLGRPGDDVTPREAQFSVEDFSRALGHVHGFESDAEGRETSRTDVGQRPKVLDALMMEGNGRRFDRANQDRKVPGTPSS